MFCFSQASLKPHQRFCALVVLLAVCALMVSLATRYSFGEEAAAPALSSVHRHISVDPSRQRLMPSAATWHPPVAHFALLDPVSSYSRVSPAGPPPPSVVFEESLYNRPPPASQLV
jgi:hypothetical protein